jgi:hypothetical protein
MSSLPKGERLCTKLVELLHALTQSGDSPGQRRCLTGGGISPYPTGWQLADIAAWAPAIRMFVMMSPTSHYMQWGRMSFKIRGEGRQFLSQLIKDRKSKVSSLAPGYLYHRRKLKCGSKPTPKIMRGVLGASAFSPPKPCSAPFTANGGLSPHINNFNLPGVVR